MATWTVMITVTPDQWLELHRRTLDCVRAVVFGLSGEKLAWEPETTRAVATESTCMEPRPFCIGAIVAHVCGAERDWLGKVNVRADFSSPRPSAWDEHTLSGVLNLIEKQYHDVLAKWPKDRVILFGLGRMCQALPGLWGDFSLSG